MSAATFIIRIATNPIGFQTADTCGRRWALSRGHCDTPLLPGFFFLKRGGFGGARGLGVELSLGVASGIRGRFAIFNLRALSQILHPANDDV